MTGDDTQQYEDFIADVGDLRDNSRWEALSRAGRARTLLDQGRKAAQSHLTDLEIQKQMMPLMVQAAEITQDEANRRLLLNLRSKRSTIRFMRLVEYRQVGLREMDAVRLRKKIYAHRRAATEAGYVPTEWDERLWSVLADE